MANTHALQSNTQKLTTIAENANDVLMTADTVFPFTLFPDTVTIDRVKVTIKKKAFFNIAKVTSIQIEDILNCEANTGPFLGSLKIWTRFFADKPIVINYLSNEDAMKIKKLLQGYIIVRHKKIDCAKIEKEKLVELLQNLGQDSTPQQTNGPNA